MNEPGDHSRLSSHDRVMRVRCVLVSSPGEGSPRCGLGHGGGPDPHHSLGGFGFGSRSRNRREDTRSRITSQRRRRKKKTTWTTPTATLMSRPQSPGCMRVVAPTQAYLVVGNGCAHVAWPIPPRNACLALSSPTAREDDHHVARMPAHWMAGRVCVCVCVCVCCVCVCVRA
ncbi:hypothetical protein LX36DRAFT_67993 [Colletotrichum falcatum]|nr:hypothetical protein LX36DRAFT_67993 [Colletotrichum falcatum]